MIFISYTKNHAGDYYLLYNPTTRYVIERRDNMWLHHMYYSKSEAVIVYLQDAKAGEGVMLNASEPKNKSKYDEKEWSMVHTRSGRVVKPLVLYMKESRRCIKYHTPKLICSLVQARWQRNKEHQKCSSRSWAMWWIWSHYQTEDNEVQGSNEQAREQLMERINWKWKQKNGDKQSMGTLGQKGFTRRSESHNINMGM